jgi:adenosylcobinamide-GDP ribazoletransferase
MTPLRIALSFLTRLPVGRVEVADHMAALGRSAWLFPLAGLVVGLITWLAASLAGLLFGPSIQAVAAIAAGLWATGMLHLDGLMDTADAVGSHRSRERMLEIMKDSRVGAMGAAAGALSLLLRFALLAETPAHLRPLALLVAPTLGRMAITLAAGIWPPARAEGGLGRSFAAHVTPGRVAGALLLGLVLAAFLPFAIRSDGLARSLAAIGAALVAALALGRSLAGRLGGLTGDTYGAINEAVEVAVLATFAALLRGWPG